MPHVETSLLIDFGATRVKSSIVQNKVLLDKLLWESRGSVTFGSKVPSSFFRNTLNEHFLKASSQFLIEQIFVCSEMHGFCLENPKTGKRTDYFSWRFSQENDQKIVENLHNKKFLDISGVAARAGLPVVNLIGSGQTYLDAGFNHILFLPHLLCDSFDGPRKRVHATMAQASGLYDLNRSMISFVDKNFDLPVWDDQNDFPLIGTSNLGGRSIPIVGGYGDLQCSINVPQLDQNKWFINLGTGSQLGVLSEKNLLGFEKRVFFDRQMLQCKTHFPAGRALRFFAQLIAEIRQECVDDFFWQEIRKIEMPSDCSHLPVFNLALFPEARGYDDGGSICGIQESTFDLNLFLQGLVYSLAKSFADEINRTEPDARSEILLIGKMFESIPAISQALGKLISCDVHYLERHHEASLLGMFHLLKRQYF